MAAQTFVLDELEPTAAVPAVEDLLAVVEAPRSEPDGTRERARAEGCAAGHAEGAAAAHAEARAQLAPAVQALHAAVESIAAERAGLADRVEQGAVELAFELAAKVVAGAIEAQPERVVDVVRGALRCFMERERVQILVHPDDLDLVRGAVAELAAELRGIDHVEVEEEGRTGRGARGPPAELGGSPHVEVRQERGIGRGGAIVRTTPSKVAASLQTKLDR